MNKRDIYLAGSTFWGGADYLLALPGVSEVVMGKTDPKTATVVQNIWLNYPDSEFLGTTETLKVTYDADIIPLPLLLEAFFLTINPFSTTKQINYVGDMPEAKIYFVDPADEEVAMKKVADLQKHFDAAVTVEVVPLETFEPAGTYAEDYIARNFGEELIIDPSLADAFVEAHKDEFGPF